MWCSSAPLPPEIDEYLLAGYLRGGPIEFVKCVSQPLEVPAQAEIAIEGYVDLNDYCPEGPFGDHTGYYTPVESFPTFRSHRHHPSPGSHLPCHGGRHDPKLIFKSNYVTIFGHFLNFTQECFCRFFRKYF